MRTVSLRLIDMSGATIPIGYFGENEYTQVRIDCKKVLSQHPDAVVSLNVSDPTGRGYTVVPTIDGTIVVWNITDSDLAARGSGEVQIVFTVDETIIGMSAVARTVIKRSVDPHGGGGGGGTGDYNDLENKPQIAGVELKGNKSLHALGIAAEADIPDVSGKADIPDEFTENNFVAFDNEGNIKDSGSKASDFLTQHQDISGKADKSDTVLSTTLSRGRKSGTTSGTGSLAFGNNTEASANYTAAFGNGTAAVKDNGFAIGESTQAGGKGSFAAGNNTLATHKSQFVFGEYNAPDTSPQSANNRGTYIEIVGNGSSLGFMTNESNARTLDWDGNERLKGKLYIEANADGTGGSEVAKKSDIPDVSGFYTKPVGGIPGTDLADSYIEEPSSEGTSGQVLTTDGNGGRSWTTVSGGGASIDDTAGEGDTTVVWSADKTATVTNSLSSAIEILEPSASASDVGKYMKVKTVADGKVTEYEFGASSGSGAEIDDTAGEGDTTVTWSADKLASEIEKIYEGSEVIVQGSINKLNPNEVETGTGLDLNGTTTARSGRVVTGYILIDTTSTSIVCSGLNAGGTKRIGLPTERICFYDGSKTFTSKVDNINSNTVTTIPSGAKYARLEITSEYNTNRAPMVEFVDAIADISATFVQYNEGSVMITYGLDDIGDLIDAVDELNSIPYGIAWDWWINANSVDKFGNAYIGYVDTDGYAGVLRRQPDGVTQYKRLEQSYNDDDHNGMATHVLSNGKVLVIGTHGHSQDNHIICYRSKDAYSINKMDELSFDISQTGDYTYACCYSQVFEYSGTLFDFMRCVCSSGGSSTAGYICLVSADNGSTWTPYKAIVGGDPYISFNYTSDDSKILKGIYGKNPASGPNDIKGFTFDMSTKKFYNLSGTEIGHLIALNNGSIDETDVCHYTDMTTITQQGSSSYKSRLFYTAKAPKANNVFLYADSTDSTLTDFTYKLYNNGTSISIGSSGVPFGNSHYVSGICFGKDSTTLYYAKATTSVADGNHELHKVKINNGAVESDDIITEASMCIIRPLFLGNGELAALVGNYNDQTQNGYGGSFTAWELKPLFAHA